MNIKRAIILHLSFILFQPSYFILRYLRDPNYLRTVSTSTIAFNAVLWLWILSGTVPMLKYPLRHIPGLPYGDTFPLGHAWLFRDRQPPDEIMKACRTVPNDGLLAFWGFFYLQARVILTTPEAIMEVINTHSYDWEKPGVTKKLLRRILGDGLVNVEGHVHRAMRKAVAPAFSGRQIRDLAPLFWSKGLAFAESMAREAKASEDGTVEMMAMMSRVTLDIIGAAGVGVDFDTINSDEHRLAKLYEIVTNTNRGPIIPFFLINVLLPPWFVKRLYGTVYARVATAMDQLRDEIQHVLAEKKNAMSLKTAEQKDIIATIMRSGDFSDDYLCDQLLTFFAAGHDTTASALTWTSWFLSSDQKIQARLRDECIAHLSNIREDEMTAEAFDDMPYLNAVCNETLRLYPTVPVTVRVAATDTRVGNTTLPKGTITLIPPWVINRLPQLWGSDADTFNPDRWLDGDKTSASGGAKSPYAFMTFIYGPRSCIGQGFAKAEMKCVLAALIMRFRFDPSESSPDVKMGGFVTLKPLGGLRLKPHEFTTVDKRD